MAAGSWLAGRLYDYFGFYAPAFATGLFFNLVNASLVAGLVLLWRRSQPRLAFSNGNKSSTDAPKPGLDRPHLCLCNACAALSPSAENVYRPQDRQSKISIVRIRERAKCLFLWAHATAREFSSIVPASGAPGWRRDRQPAAIFGRGWKRACAWGCPSWIHRLSLSCPGSRCFETISRSEDSHVSES